MLSRKTTRLEIGKFAAAAIATLALGASGCAGGDGPAAAAQATVVAGELRADGTRAYWRFEAGGAACVVRAASEASARASVCPAVALPTPVSDLTGAVEGALAASTLHTTDPPEEPGFRAVAGEPADLSSIGIGTGGR